MNICVVPFHEASNTRVIRMFLSTKELPERLQSLDGLYYKGNASLLNEYIIAVVGKRDVSDKEFTIAYDVGRFIAEQGIVVANGVARGCDQAALQGALDAGGKTIAIMPCGVDIVYPYSARKILNQIIANNGCIISEYPDKTKPQKWQFIARDQIQALIADKVCVIASDLNGGTMHTINYSLKNNKEMIVYWDKKGNQREGNIFLKDKAKTFSSKTELNNVL